MTYPVHHLWHRVRRRLGPRRFQAFGVGPPKSGTNSLANMFVRNYRSMHEADAPVVIDWLRGIASGEAELGGLRAYLRRRDQRLRLEMDASGMNSRMIEAIVAEFPEARYIVTVRDCFSWANSAINQMLNHDDPAPHWRDYRVYLYGELETCRYPEPERILADHTMWSLERVFSAWVDFYRPVLRWVPRERALFVATDRLRADIERIASFLGVPPHSLDGSMSHSHRAPRDFDLIHEIDPAHVDATASRICGEIMSQLYPGRECSLSEDYTD